MDALNAAGFVRQCEHDVNHRGWQLTDKGFSLA